MLWIIAIIAFGLLIYSRIHERITVKIYLDEMYKSYTNLKHDINFDNAMILKKELEKAELLFKESTLEYEKLNYYKNQFGKFSRYFSPEEKTALGLDGYEISEIDHLENLDI